MITVDRLVNVLGSYGVRLRWSSVPRSTELRSVVIPEDAADRPVVGDVLLAIGAGSLREAMRWAASAHAVVVLMRDGAEPITFDDDAEAGAVMLVDETASWSELAAVVYGLVLEGRETESGRGPTDLFALADSLADAIGGAVVIHDRLLRVLAYSRLQQHADPARAETILGRQTTEQLRALFETRGVFTHLAISDDPLFVAEDAEHGLTGRMVVAVRSGRELIGSAILDASQDSPNVITVFGKQLGRLALLVVPPYTNHSDAYTALTAAASIGDASAPDKLLGLSEHSEEDRHHALALQRWECEGGALRAPAPRSRPQMHAESSTDL